MNVRTLARRLLIVLGACVLPGQASSAEEALEIPLPTASTNAAVHYQRALLYLSAADPSQQEMLLKPIWEIVSPDSDASRLSQLDQLLVDNRNALRATMVATDQAVADFGVDLRHYLIAEYLPHTQWSPSLARLVALHGLQRQSAGQWQAAADAYLRLIRMGRHFTHATTLAEALAGIEILETGYYGLGHWATRCPDTALVEEAFNLVHAAAPDMVNPARILRLEASIVQLRLDTLQQSFPDGPWAEIVLEMLSDEIPDRPSGELRQAAIDAAVSQGVPQEAFANEEAFNNYLAKLRSIYVRLAKESAKALSLPPPASVAEGQKVFAQYEEKLLPTERAGALNTAKIAGYFAVHQAELDLVRLVLAVSAEKTSSRFPTDLNSVAERFGGTLPRSPFDATAYRYEALADGKGFSLSVSKATVGGIEFPPIEFRYVPE